ncbi:MAG: MFS transporter [Cytophagaceae bacterium]|nr:MFS transporter [Cytophagaceae bacterium]MDW8455815.1 MFS transporter [Cytophagaceae bacterium]
MKDIVKNNPKLINAWCMYDWANSVYSLTITTAVFPIYFLEVIKASGKEVSLLWFTVPNKVIYNYLLTIAFLSIALINPLLSGIADYSGKKKTFMKFFAWLGAFSCTMLYFFDTDTLWVGFLFSILASVGYAGSLVFYNAYLPEITTEDNFDKVSARGFSLGYAGSVILLIINLLMIEMYETLGFKNKAEPSRISFLTVGIWWFAFSLYTFYHLPHDKKNKSDNINYLRKGYDEINNVFRKIRHHPTLKKFLLGFFFYNMAFQTIMYLATIFGSEQLNIPTSGLIITVLIIQVIAIAGAYLFSISSSKLGNVKTLLLALAVSLLVCISAWFVRSEYQFYGLACIVGIVMGGLQSLSRATYSKLIPQSNDNASYFSFYELTDKTGTSIGIAVYGIITHATGNMKNTIFGLAAFFLLGMYLLTTLMNSKVNKT